MSNDESNGASAATRQRITAIVLELAETGTSSDAVEDLFAAIYGELHIVAGKLMWDQKPGHTLQPTALVHEAYLKLVNANRVQWEGRSHFLRLAARAMRQILVNHARDRSAAKRGGGWQRVTIHDEIDGTPDREFEILTLHQALEKLASKDERMAEVVELRVFAGMTAVETAHVLGVSKRTVDNDLKVAKLWLLDEFSTGRET